jgi:serine phosphatase RsbU (regulator of sigma subunit)
MTIEVPSLKAIVTQVNSVLYGITKGKQKVNCFVAVLDIRTGRLELVNSGLPAPYLLRNGGPSSKNSDETEKFRPLTTKKNSSLAVSRTVRVDADSLMLKPGDMIFWYTSALLGAVNPRGEALGSDQVFDVWSELYDQYEGQAPKVASECIEKFRSFFGDFSNSPSEDVTIVVGSVPKSAKFEEETEGVS